MDTNQNDEMMLGEVFEEIADRLAEARTRALMGEREQAHGLFQGASLEWHRFRNVLGDYPGSHAMEYAIETTLQALEHEANRVTRAEEEATAAKTRRPRRRAA